MDTTLTFRLTYDDYTEALKAHLEAAKTPPTIGPDHMMPPNAVKIIGGPDPKRGAARFSRSMLGWILILSIAILIFVVFHNRRPPTSPPPAPAARVSSSPFLDVLINFLPYILIFLVIWFFFLRQVRKRNKSRKDLESNPDALQERTVDILDTGLRISVPTNRHEYDWLAYKNVVETPNLFLLYHGDLEFQIVPKRAFTSPQGALDFRQLLESHIGDRRQTAFPVVTSSPQPPT